MVMVPEYFKEFQKFWGEFLKTQEEMLRNLTSMFDFSLKFNVLRNDIAVFRAKVQSGGRISIPEADRQALNIKEGDVVKVIIVKEGGD
ncbi:AbrB/MazE/SpoVT family DNA-binding domain-containing protein [Ferroglobus sp.]|uniref:AbrB/MazE/SpoVT family DNA-binding domain-containing protein n=1 Tax=Ferroglobus sp. TaxID=2614230 RepID=UPI0025BCD9CF|nr:AbrB/MazE/SpoVT family DNA-binding domain-containing protein [Ferroglobus sp.]